LANDKLKRFIIDIIIRKKDANRFGIVPYTT